MPRPRLIGGVLAQHASIAMIGAAAEAQFDAALASRDIIGQAKVFSCTANTSPAWSNDQNLLISERCTSGTDT